MAFRIPESILKPGELGSALYLVLKRLHDHLEARVDGVPDTGEHSQTGIRSPEFWRSRKRHGGVAAAARDGGIARSRLRGRTTATGRRSPRAGAVSGGVASLNPRLQAGLPPGF